MEIKASKSRKKGFMTPERKKKLRVGIFNHIPIQNNRQIFYSLNRKYFVFKSFNYTIQLLLRKKAAEELKKEQELKAKERRKVIDQRCGEGKKTDGLGESM